jgi:uncharacterized protein (DUF1778 family)
MAARTERFEARVAPREAARIRRAASLENMSTSAFVVSSAVSRADEVIASHQMTAVPPDFFDRLVRALEEPGKTLPRLARAARRARQQSR